MKAVNLNPVHPIMETIIEYKSENRRLSYLIKQLTNKMTEITLDRHRQISAMKNHLACANEFDSIYYELAKKTQIVVNKLDKQFFELVEIRRYLIIQQRNNGEIILRNRSWLQVDTFGL